jgi:hypothetical protein
MGRFFLIFFSIFFLFLPVRAYDRLKSTIALVGISTTDFPEEEKTLLNGRNILELNFDEGWYQTAVNHGAQEIVIKQPSGFLGLYTPSGILIRALNSPENYEDNLVRAAGNQYYKQWDQTGYTTGGRIDPYRPMTMHEKNMQVLNPGWGYSKVREEPGIKDSIFKFLSFVPLDVVTPFNYPGTFDSTGIPAAYGLGVLPHIGGLAIEMRNANKEHELMVENRAAIPYYAEYPVQYYNSAEPSNPYTRDPNLIRQNQMPEAFYYEYPYYDQAADYYRLYGKEAPYQ